MANKKITYYDDGEELSEKRLVAFLNNEHVEGDDKFEKALKDCYERLSKSKISKPIKVVRKE